MTKKLLFLLNIIVIGFSLNTYTYILTSYMDMPVNRANELFTTMLQMTETYPEFSILDIISIMGIETGGKNIYGDNGKAIGYFQLHPAAIYYVWAYYPQLGREKFKSNSIRDLLYFPTLQVQIATTYLHLLYLRTHSKKEAIALYNGDVNNTNHYYEKFTQYQTYLLKEVLNGKSTSK